LIENKLKQIMKSNKILKDKIQKKKKKKNNELIDLKPYQRYTLKTTLMPEC